VSGGQVLWFDNVGSDFILPSITGTVFAAVNSNPDTITRTSGSFVTDGFIPGQKITMSGWANAGNNATFSIAQVAANTLTLVAANTLTAEAAGASVTIHANRERLLRSPASGAEQDEAQSIVLADGDVTLDAYITALNFPAALAIPAGVWEFHAWAWVSSGSTTTMKFRVAKVDTAGVATVLFTTAATTVTATSAGAAQEIVRQYTIAADIPLSTTDRLVVYVIGNNSSTTARTLHFVYQGTTRASNVQTTLAVGLSAPPGGLTNQALVKKSDATYDVKWGGPYAELAGAAFTGTVTAPGLAPDAGPSVRNTYFLTAPPDAALGSDGDIAIVVG
jgi:hypothetical protein